MDDFPPRTNGFPPLGMDSGFWKASSSRRRPFHDRYPTLDRSTVTVVVTALAGIVFGLALAAPPGPMNAIIAEESVLRGWSAGFRAGLGAMLADVVFFLLALAGVVAVVDSYPAVRPLLYVLGGVLMLYFAVGAFEEARSAASFTDVDPGESNGFKKTFVLSLSNPYQIGFWLTVGVGLLETGQLDVFAHVPGVGDLLRNALVVQTGSPTLLVGFFAGIAVWIVAYPAALVSAGRRVDAFAPAVAAFSAVVLSGFGIVFLAMGTFRVL
ncbi:LysE family translocator [Natrarchaeobius sp. A-rgal3]|uniref:LysE family translocator n=1 Tax=Natrarchaeobius versutus TaxID=1679078 RepID=UPI003510B3CA